MLNIEEVLDCLRNEVFTIESSTSIVESNASIAKMEIEHYADRFNIGQKREEKLKIQCKLCHRQNHPWFKCHKYRS